MRLIAKPLMAVLLGACSVDSLPFSSALVQRMPEAGAAQVAFDRDKEILYWALMDALPVRAVSLGHHQYDGRLPDVSAAGIADRIAQLEQAMATLAAIPAAELSRASQLEREVLLSHIRGQLFGLQTLENHRRNPRFYLQAFDLADYISRDYAPLAERARGIMGICDGAGEIVEHARNNLQPVMPRTWIETALRQVRGLIEFVRGDVVEAAAGLDAAAAAELARSLDRCTAALQTYETFLDERLAQASDDYALGEEIFVRMLHRKEGLTIERLQAIGQADFERNLRALALAAAQVAPGKSVREAIDLVARDRPQASELLAVASEQADDMRRFLVDRQIVTIPDDEPAEVRESPPFRRWNSAFLDTAGVFEEDSLPSYYYISPPDPSWPAEVQQGYIPFENDLLFTTIHELWPGHFLHWLHRKKNPSRILKSFCSYSMSEGWAHYSEEMMVEQGLGRGDPAVRIGLLVNALLRDARLMSAVGLHARGMTLEQSIELFESQAYASHGTARQQAVRGTFDPGYFNYTLGKLMILKLREDWKARQGDAYSLRAFHDEFLSHGCAPVPVIRRFMLGDDAGPVL